ncbi:syndecan-2-like isoform X2 [Echeneis naucrates]|uniref:syndecan-2-like isoform X2 n=1 Tax=Echeneis naucrates TaxID=173247 RepID=UPI0011137DB1|nr:syndecan-2-like isoform X2 [Echeneis naucrates]
MRSLWLFLIGLATGITGEKLLVSSQSPFTTDDLYIEGQTSGDLPIDDEDGRDGSGSGSGDFDKEELYRRFLNLSETTFIEDVIPVQPKSTAYSPQNPSTTAAAALPSIFPDGDKEEEEPSIGPTDDWIVKTTIPSSTSMPPSKTTTVGFSSDVSVTKDTSEDTTLDKLGVSTSKDKEMVLAEENFGNAAEANGQGRIYEMDSPKEVSSENLWKRTEVLAAVIACGVIGFLCAVFLLLLLGYRMKKKDEGSYELGDTKLSSTAYHKAPTKEFYA